MSKVEFNGAQKLIIVNDGITSLDVKTDLYSDWKEWVQLTDNSKYVPAFESIGGQPIGGGLFAGSIFFLQNGWKIRPQEADHTLTIVGNIFTDDGSEMIIPTIGDFTVTVKLLVTNLAQGIETGSGLTSQQATQLLEIWKLMGLDIAAALEVNTSNRTAGTISQNISTNGGTVTVQRE